MRTFVRIAVAGALVAGLLGSVAVRARRRRRAIWSGTTPSVVPDDDTQMAAAGVGAGVLQTERGRRIKGYIDEITAIRERVATMGTSLGPHQGTPYDQ